MASFSNAPVSHERTPASEHGVRVNRAYLVLNAQGRITADDTGPATAGFLVSGARLVGEAPATTNDVALRRYGNRVTS